MTKYVNYHQKQGLSVKERMVIHPIWRGIGLILAIVLPVMSYLVVLSMLENPGGYPWLPLPPELILRQFSDPLILLKLIYSLVLTFFIFAVITLLTFMINSLVKAFR